MMRKYVTTALCAIAFALLLSSLGGRALADPESASWSPLVAIASSGAFKAAAQIAVSGDGVVHVAWAQSNDYQPIFNSIYYAHTQSGTWSEPVDVLMVPDNTRLLLDGMIYSSDDQVLLLWHSADQLLLSHCPARLTESAASWRTRVVDATSIRSAALVQDKTGTLHIVYTVDDVEVRHTTSTDFESFTGRSLVASTYSATEFPDQLRLACDVEGGLYATWSDYSVTVSGRYGHIMVASSQDGGSTWSTARLAHGEGLGQSAVHVTSNPARVHVTWVGSLAAGGRYQRWSEDHANTWSPVIILVDADQIAGYAGAVNLLQRPDNSLHAVYSGVGHGRDRIWYSVWAGYKWSDANFISSEQIDPEGAMAVVDSAGTIHAAWAEQAVTSVWQSTVWYRYQANPNETADHQSSATPMLYVTTPTPSQTPHTSHTTVEPPLAEPTPASSTDLYLFAISGTGAAVATGAVSALLTVSLVVAIGHGLRQRH